MKQRFLLFRRNGVYYIEDREGTPRQRSLGTKDEAEARRLLAAHNEAAHQQHLNRQMARIYISASEPDFAKRTWEDVFEAIIRTKKGSTKVRWETARKDVHLASLANKKLIEATAKVFLDILHAGTVSTNVYLRRLHNFALGMGWIMNAVIPPKQWPSVTYGTKRAITRKEHDKILARELNPERRDFYDLLWQLGGSQGDVASLHAEDVNWSDKTIGFDRCKMRSRGGRVPPVIHFGPLTAELLKRRPGLGPLFPYLSRVRSGDRATEFHQRCEGLGITGITLHSYRYSWAERAAEAGYPERWAMEALGHGSKAVHRTYAKKAKVKIPSLESYEAAAAEKIIQFQQPTLARQTDGLPELLISTI